MYIGASLKHKPGLREAANHGHADILDALEKRDVEAAVKALDEHLRTSIGAFESEDRGLRPASRHLLGVEDFCGFCCLLAIRQQVQGNPGDYQHQP